MLIHLSFLPSVIISVLHLLKREWERRGKKLLGLGAVAAVSDVEGGLAAAAAQPETSNMWPSDGDGVGARGERGMGIGVGGRERGKEDTTDLRIRERINGPHSKTVWAESQLRFKVRYCRMPSPALS